MADAPKFRHLRSDACFMQKKFHSGKGNTGAQNPD
jgi:hypothetical protein